MPTQWSSSPPGLKFTGKRRKPLADAASQSGRVDAEYERTRPSGCDLRDAVLPKGVRRVAVEAGVTDYWRKYVGLEGAVVGLDRFGESAPAGELFKFFGITAEAVVAAVKRVI